MPIIESPAPSRYNRQSEGNDLSRSGLLKRYADVRSMTRNITRPLAAEDHVVQSMEDVSPTKWHLAHTTWFFETFVLGNYQEGYEPFHPAYAYLFNSYYVQAGARFSRPHRGLLSRPTVAEVEEYRDSVDQRMMEYLAKLDDDQHKVAEVVVLGLNHEQQHQELILTDIKHVLSRNPLNPAYTQRRGDAVHTRNADWLAIEPGVYAVGFDGSGFSFDNEGPRHRVFVEPVLVADRLVTNREFAEFIRDGGYQRPELWLSEGWAAVERERWAAPIYWDSDGDGWSQFTLFGVEPVADDEPVCHVSYFEADAFARWSGCRLPTEFEWEVAVGDRAWEGNFLETGNYHPRACGDGDQFYGDVWEWTSSAYAAFPGYKPASGALGEYNGKFMCNQFVLRGGSCATSSSHIRRTYRNFFPPHARWQFAGIRLARDV